MTVRSIASEDIKAFEQMGVTNSTQPVLNLQKWIDAGRTKLEWCYILEEAGEILARIIYGVFEDQPLDLKIWHFKVDTAKADLMEAGSMLISESLQALKEMGFKTVEFHMYSSPAIDFIKLQSVFQSQNFQITQEKKTYECEIKESLGFEKRLTFKTLEDLGEESFISAIEHVSNKTLDRDDLESIEINGSKKAAEMYFEILKEMDYNPKWWRLAYDAQGQFAGLIVPQRFSEEEGVINYIGVPAEQRGNGYVLDLINEAINIMIEEKVEVLMADIDVLNLPLEQALLKCGFEETRTMAVLKKSEI